MHMSVHLSVSEQELILSFHFSVGFRDVTQVTRHHGLSLQPYILCQLQKIWATEGKKWCYEVFKNVRRAGYPSPGPSSVGLCIFHSYWKQNGCRLREHACFRQNPNIAPKRKGSPNLRSLGFILAGFFSPQLEPCQQNTLSLHWLHYHVLERSWPGSHVLDAHSFTWKSSCLFPVCLSLRMVCWGQG